MKKLFFSFFITILFLYASFYICVPIAFESRTSLTLKWAKELGISSSKKISGNIALDNRNNIYLSVQGDPGYSNGKLISLNPNGVERWTFSVRNFSITNPMIDSKNTIFVFSTPSLYALSPDGTLIWELENMPNLCHFALGSQVLYATDCLKGAYTRKIWSINTTGKINWSVAYENIAKIAVDADNNLLIFHFDRFEKETHIMCLNSEDGSVIWKYLLKDDVTNTTGVAISLDNSILINLKNTLLSLNAKGTLNWEIKSFASRSPPIINNEGIVFCTNEKDMAFTAISSTGNIKWRKQNFASFPCFVTNKGIISYSLTKESESFLTSLNTLGDEVWKYPISLYISSPVISNDSTLYMFDDIKVLAIQCSENISKGSWPRDFHDNQNTNCVIIADVPVYLPKKVTIQMSIGSTIANVNDFPQIIDAPFLYKNRTYLPFRFLGDFIGADINFTINPIIKTVSSVSFETQKKCLTLFIDQYKVMINGYSFVLDSTPIIRNHRTYIPVRFVSESLGANVEWDTKTQTVTIIYEES